MTTTPTTPQPPTQPEPMSDEAIMKIAREAAAGGAFRRDGSTSLRVGRAIESATADAWRSHLAARDAEVAALREKYEAALNVIVDLCGELREPEFDEARALRKDAERYRWLRARIPGGTYRIMGVIYSEGGAGVDAAIDAAIDRAGGARDGA